jgi:hypothetical protein
VTRVSSSVDELRGVVIAEGGFGLHDFVGAADALKRRQSGGQGRGVQTVINSIVRQRLRLSGHCGMPLIILGDDASVAALCGAVWDRGRLKAAHPRRRWTPRG